VIKMVKQYSITYNDIVFENNEKEAIKTFIKVLKKNPEYVKQFGTIKVEKP